MNDLRISITILVSYVIAILGVANIDEFQESYIDFSPIFFILIAIVIFSELILVSLLIRSGVKLRYYSVIVFWVIVYAVMWAFYSSSRTTIEVHIIQFLLLILSAILAYDVGRRIGELDKTLEGLSSSAYPNRARDMQSSRDLIAAEITRSRRYHHPLSLLTIKLGKPTGKEGWRELETLASDMYERFAIAKVSQILSDLARSTDIILYDRDGQFVLLCPETNLNNISVLAERMEAAVEESINAKIDWGTAAFPDEALTFEDLLQTAQKRLATPGVKKITDLSTNEGA
jgi:hypothetical protein